tara:strand:+ start:2794 stop:3276 length:483 start_codon:yes stop_codon:yes gene_type:complete
MASTRIRKSILDFLKIIIQKVREPLPGVSSPVSNEQLSTYIKASERSPSWIQPGDLVMFNYNRPTSETHLVLVVANERTKSGIFRSTAIFRGTTSNILLSGFKLDASNMQSSIQAVKSLYKNRQIKYSNVKDTIAILGSENYRTYLTNRNYMSNFNEVEF